jgi:hypothetical protein
VSGAERGLAIVGPLKGGRGLTCVEPVGTSAGMAAGVAGVGGPPAGGGRQSGGEALFTSSLCAFRRNIAPSGVWCAGGSAAGLCSDGADVLARVPVAVTRELPTSSRPADSARPSAQRRPAFATRTAKAFGRCRRLRKWGRSKLTLDQPGFDSSPSSRMRRQTGT